MADLQKTVDITFRAHDKTEGAVESVSSRMSSLEAHIGSVTGPIANLTLSVLKYEAVIAGLAAAYAAFTIKQAADFESAQISLAKVLTGSPDSVAESMIIASAEAVRLSEKYGLSSSIILQGMAQFKQSGFTALEAATLQKTAMDLVIAGGVNAATATNLLTRSLIGFGAEANEATRFAEALNNVSNRYNTNLELLALGMSKLSPIASLMGFTFEETAGLITPIIEVFGSGREAATALKTGLLKLVDDAKPVVDALTSLGITQFQLNGEMKTGKEIFFEVARAFELLTQKQRITFTSQLVGIEQSGRMATVFSNLAKVNEITAVAMERTGSVTKEVTLRLDSATVQASRTAQAFNNMSVEIGTKLLPGFDDANEGLRILLASFREVVADGGLDPLFDSINSEGVELKDFLVEIAKILPQVFADLDFDELISSFGKLKEEVSELFGDLDLTKPEDLTLALQKVINFLGLMTNATSGVVRGFSPFIDALTGMLEKLAKFDPDDQDFIGFLAGTLTGINAILPAMGFATLALVILGTKFRAVASAKFIAFLGFVISKMPLFTPLGAAVVASISAVNIAVLAGIDAYDEYNKRQDKVNEAWIDNYKNSALLEDGYARITKATRILITNTEEFNSALDQGLIVQDDSVVGWKRAGAALDDLGTDVTSAGDTVKKYDAEVEKMALSSEKASKKVVSFADAANAVAASLGIANPKLAKGADSLKKVEETAKDADTALEKLSDREKLVIKHTHDMEKTLLELASNEKIRSMEFVVDIKIAQIEAEAQKVEAVFESISSAVESTQAATADMFDSFAQVYGDLDLREKWDLERLLTEQTEQAQQALDLQKKAVEAQIELWEAQADSLTNGLDIAITADGLEPEIEAFMFKILERIQTKISGDKTSFLLGAGI